MNRDEDPGVVLTCDEAWRLLEGSRFGRLAVSVANQPDVFPLNFFASGDKVWIRTNPGSKLAELTINSRVAFEADEVSDGAAWSVVVKGTARILESQTEIDAADRLPLEPWLKTRKWTYVEITPSSVSGRKFQLGAEPERY
ncbi:pyridoxamine 5'-phosphate oxidase family protein [Arthrobacter sp. SDTb3-6]|uniref:pyridoxamine 5'-phosphate oxidase family protein n=1 Tax=Arthrobacter sp. SDTb3-6 TaxID=2713571 RepID=UPI00159DE445|nr:pyridoxamine 5'-phosphate oxidase family protein [Arthrobacter sp. SDTb3-6]NVM99823.1 pyridoxamine 5'-phosphate oxidase family protein [Arthrobacter sp. SDTb3-6]